MSIATAAANNNKTSLKSFPKEKKEEDLQAFFSFTAWKDKGTQLTPRLA